MAHIALMVQETRKRETSSNVQYADGCPCSWTLGHKEWSREPLLYTGPELGINEKEKIKLPAESNSTTRVGEGSQYGMQVHQDTLISMRLLEPSWKKCGQNGQQSSGLKLSNTSKEHRRLSLLCSVPTSEWGSLLQPSTLGTQPLGMECLGCKTRSISFTVL